MAGTRDWEDHKIRRRIWDHGFSQKALKSYEPRILGLLDELCEGLAAQGGMQFCIWFSCSSSLLPALYFWFSYYTDMFQAVSLISVFGVITSHSTPWAIWLSMSLSDC